jgi:diadenosine tetraphosphate (Ap4A) HIT family hydrolase
MYHYRKTRTTYRQHNANDKSLTACTFCSELDTSANITKDGKTMFVLPNRVSYDIFEGRRVTSHLMIIPKRHVKGFGEFTDEEMLEMMHMTAEYEKEGYNVYARGWGNVSRSVEHQHTHLIKTDDKPTRAIFFVRKPYVLVKF